MAPGQPIDADQAAQDVVNAWNAMLTGPKPHTMSTDFSVLFAKMQSYRMAKRGAENPRHYNLITEQAAAQEQRTTKEFMDAYQAFYEGRRPPSRRGVARA
jgi:hypothetical protein